METRIIKFGPSREGIDEAIGQAVEVLTKGGLVGFPTETVYGLAANADLPESVQKLAKIKQRPVNKPFTLHIGDKKVVSRYVPNISLLNRQLLRKAWPGPLTVVFNLNAEQMEQVREKLPAQQVEALYHNHSIGMRLPDYPAAQQLLTAVEKPIVAPSANISGEMPPISADEVLSELSGKIDLLLDGGTTRYAKASTIARLTGDSLEILREGVLDADVIRRMRSLTILFVCTGNSCRSPMAEGFCKQMVADKLDCSVDQLEEKGYKIESAGVLAYDGAQASPESIEVCREAGVDICSHKARYLTAGLLEHADIVYVMDRTHRQAVMELAISENKQSLGRRLDFLSHQGDIADPIGMSLETYRRCAKRIAESVKERLAEIF